MSEGTPAPKPIPRPKRVALPPSPPPGWRPPQSPTGPSGPLSPSAAPADVPANSLMGPGGSMPVASEQVIHSPKTGLPPLPPAIQLRNRNATILAQAGPLYDRINSAWNRAEEYIQNLGVLAPVDYEYYDNGQGRSASLGVQKRNGKWRICQGTYDHHEQMYAQMNGDDYGVDWTLITECGIELRTEMLKHLEPLMEKIVETNEKTIPRLAKSVEEAEATLKKLGIS